MSIFRKAASSQLGFEDQPEEKKSVKQELCGSCGGSGGLAWLTYILAFFLDVLSLSIVAILLKHIE